jgi:hypothetical protein
VPPGVRLADGNPSVIVAGAIFPWPTEHVLDLILAHVVAIDVRFASFRVDVIANVHFSIPKPLALMKTRLPSIVGSGYHL